jgi:hypothetical protein
MLLNNGGEGEDSIKSALNEIGCEGMDWIQLAQGRVQWWGLVNMAMDLKGSMRGKEFLD